MTRFKISLATFLTGCVLISLAFAAFYRKPLPDKLSIQIIEDTITVTARPTSHFHVLFTNHSKRRVRLWDEWIMWGHCNLSFELFDSKNQSLGFLGRQNKWFGRNFPRWTELEPGESFVMDVYFDPKEWSIPLKPGANHECVLVTNFNVPRTPESDQNEVWVGSIKSKPKKVTLRYWGKQTAPKLPAPAP